MSKLRGAEVTVGPMFRRIEGKVERGGETYRRVEKLIGDRNLQGVETYRETYRIGETKETYTSENAHRGERLTGE